MADATAPSTSQDGAATPVLEVRDLKKHFPVRHGFFGRAGGEVYAVDGVGLAEEPARLGLPGPLAFRAVVGHQVVVAGDAVHGRGERVDPQPPLVETVGQLTRCAHGNVPGTRRRDRVIIPAMPPRPRVPSLPPLWTLSDR